MARREVDRSGNIWGAPWAGIQERILERSHGRRARRKWGLSGFFEAELGENHLRIKFIIRTWPLTCVDLLVGGKGGMGEMEPPTRGIGPVWLERPREWRPRSRA